MRLLSDLDRLLTTMDVTVCDFELREISAGASQSAPSPSTLMHYVVDGVVTATLLNREPMQCGPETVMFPPGMELKLNRGGKDRPPTIATANIVAKLSDSFGLVDRAAVPLIEDMSQSEIVRHAFAASRWANRSAGHRTAFWPTCDPRASRLAQASAAAPHRTDCRGREDGRLRRDILNYPDRRLKLRGRSAT